MDTHAVRPTVVVLFPDDWASYSPTLIRLVDLLSKRFDVTAWVFDTGRFDLGTLSPQSYHRIRIPSLLATLLRKSGAMQVLRPLLLALRSQLATRRASHVVAVDSDGAIAAALLGRRFHFLSLEIRRWSVARWLVPLRALSVITQSVHRLRYQFAAESLAGTPVFFIQNAPCASALVPVIEPVRDLSRPRLVYMGNVIASHGLLRMLDLLGEWPAASLTIHGVVSDATLKMIEHDYPELVSGRRLKISTQYLTESEVPSFLAGFDLGLCLYELQGRMRHDYNYVSSPAGKMFNYFAAGIPVIASSLVGLDPVSTHRAGIQAPSNSAQDLRHAGEIICADYASFREGALRAAREYDFERSANGLLDLLDRISLR